MSIWYVYIIEASDQSLYTGITIDPVRRWHQHHTGKGAKFFRGRSPKRLCYLEKMENKSEALKREYQIKKLARAKKASLFKKPENIASHFSSIIDKTPA